MHHARGKSGFTPYLSLGKPKAKTEVLDFAQEIPDFSERLTALVAEILDPDRRFTPLTDEEKNVQILPVLRLVLPLTASTLKTSASYNRRRSMFFGMWCNRRKVKP